MVTKAANRKLLERQLRSEVRRGTEVIEKLPNIPTQVGLGDRFQRDHDLILIQNSYKIGSNPRVEPNFR